MISSKILKSLRASTKSPELKAAITFVLRRDRQEHPSGTFDAANRWYPDDEEDLDISCLRLPSRAWPYSYLHAARTAKHCASLHQVERRMVLILAKEIDAAGKNVTELRKRFPAEDVQTKLK